MSRSTRLILVAALTSAALLGCNELVGSGDFDFGDTDAGMMDAGPPPDGGPDAGNDAGDAGPPPTYRRVGALSAGADFTCGFMEGEGNVFCWGANTKGQLGRGTTPGDTAVPASVVISDEMPLTGATGVSNGGEHACARIGAPGSAEVYCWGRDDKGQLGNISSGDQSFAVLFQDESEAAFTTVNAFAAGRKHTCVTLEDGSVWCTGLNDAGQLGVDDRSDRDLGTQVVGEDGMGLFAGARTIGAGLESTCAFRSDTMTSIAYCWGVRPNCGSVINTPFASRDFGSPFASLQVGDAYMCATSPGQGVRCVGANTVGQLGNGVSDGMCSPMVVDVAHPGGGNLSGVVELSVGLTHACATTGEDTFCWGEGSAGELGDGSMGMEVSSSTPVVVAGPGGGGSFGPATHIAAGDTHSCAVLSPADEDDRIYCWGEGFGATPVNVPLP